MSMHGNLSLLIGRVLEDRGNAVLVMADPGDGEDAVILTVNAPFERIVGKAANLLVSAPLRTLKSVVDDPADWVTFISSVRGLAPLHLDLRLRVNNREVWFGFGSDFKSNESGSFGILIGRDITESRRRTMLEGETQRMLASVFHHLSVAVVIVRSNGKILMANLAFQEMLGYSGNALAELNVETLTSPEHAEAARGARVQQLLDGASYDMRLETIAKGGTRLPVTLHSVLLKAWKGEQIRVVTLIPDAVTRSPAAKKDISQPTPPLTVRRGVGQMKAVSLAALKASYGDDWPQIASRAMMLAEHTIKRRLGSADVFGRSDNEGFVIWFDSSDETRNETVLARITREIRLRFLNELGTDVAARLSSVMVRINVDPANTKSLSAQPVPSAALLQGLNEERQRVIADLDVLVRDLRSAPAADVRPIIDCHGKSKAIVLVDFFPTTRRRIFEFSTLGLNLFEQSLDFDLLRLDMAVPELANRRRSGKVLLPISWPSLTIAACRQRFDERLVRLGAVGRSRLMLAISGVPPHVDAKAWLDIVGLLQRQCSGVGLMLNHSERGYEQAQEAIVSGWQLSLLVIDSAVDESSPFDYMELMSITRRRDIPVLILPTIADDVEEWETLGATMFIAPA